MEKRGNKRKNLIRHLLCDTNCGECGEAAMMLKRDAERLQKLHEEVDRLRAGFETINYKLVTRRSATMADINDVLTLMRALRDVLSSDPEMPTHEADYKAAEDAYEQVQAKLRDAGDLPADLED